MSFLFVARAPKQRFWAVSAGAVVVLALVSCSATSPASPKAIGLVTSTPHPTSQAASSPIQKTWLLNFKVDTDAVQAGLLVSFDPNAGTAEVVSKTTDSWQPPYSWNTTSADDLYQVGKEQSGVVPIYSLGGGTGVQIDTTNRSDFSTTDGLAMTWFDLRTTHSLRVAIAHRDANNAMISYEVLSYDVENPTKLGRLIQTINVSTDDASVAVGPDGKLFLKTTSDNTSTQALPYAYPWGADIGTDAGDGSQEFRTLDGKEWKVFQTRESGGSSSLILLTRSSAAANWVKSGKMAASPDVSDQIGSVKPPVR